jgi:hypothetical protein
MLNEGLPLDGNRKEESMRLTRVRFPIRRTMVANQVLVAEARKPLTPSLSSFQN